MSWFRGGITTQHKIRQIHLAAISHGTNLQTNLESIIWPGLKVCDINFVTITFKKPNLSCFVRREVSQPIRLIPNNLLESFRQSTKCYFDCRRRQTLISYTLQECDNVQYNTFAFGSNSLASYLLKCDRLPQRLCFPGDAHGELGDKTFIVIGISRLH